MSKGSFFTAPEYHLKGHPVWPNEPVIFLAGPIQGAADWQSLAAGIIAGLDPDIHVASPRRLLRHEGDFDKQMYEEQVRWEHHYLDYASRHGVTLFWLANEKEHRCDRAYAQTTRFELGEAMMRHQTLGSHVIVGFDTAFSNRRYLETTLTRKAVGIPLRVNLWDTCHDAVALLHGLYRTRPQVPTQP